VIVAGKEAPVVGKYASPRAVVTGGYVLHREALPPRIRVDMRLTRGLTLAERVNAYNSPPSVLLWATDATVPGVETIL
jgi:hypothetical protein